jgi:hypothetical protein
MSSSARSQPVVSLHGDTRTVRLLDTTDRSDATACGYDGSCDPREDMDGLIVTRDADDWVTILAGDGEIKLPPQAAKVLAEMILGTVFAGRQVQAKRVA